MDFSGMGPDDSLNAFEQSSSDQKVRVVFFATQLYNLACGKETGFGGAETEMWNVATCLSQDSRFDTRVVTLTDQLRTPEKFNDVTLYPAPPPPILSYDDPWLRRRTAILKYYHALFQVLKNQKGDIYYTKLASAEACLVWLAARCSSRKFVFRIEHDWETNLPDLTNQIFRGKRLYARLFVSCLRRASLVIVQTSKQKSALQRNFGIESEIISNAHLLPNKADIETSLKNRPTVLWIGRCHPMKRPWLFLEIAQKLPDVAFTMIMPPSTDHDNLFQQTRKEADDLKNVEFIPGVAPNKTNAFYRRASLFILTSDAEGFSNVIIEAMKNGCPVLTLDHNPNDILMEPAIPERPDAAAGYCVNDCMDAAIQITGKLVSDNDLWENCHQAALELVSQNFGIDHILPIYKDHFFKLAGGR